MFHGAIGRVVEDLMLASLDPWNYEGHQLPHAACLSVGQGCLGRF